MDVFQEGSVVLSDSHWPDSHSVRLFEPCVIAVRGTDEGSYEGILASTSTSVVTDNSWKCSATLEDGWDLTGFNDAHWENATVVGSHGDAPWGRFDGIDLTAKWIWTSNSLDDVVYCRKELCESSGWTGVCCSSSPVFLQRVLLRGMLLRSTA